MDWIAGHLTLLSIWLTMLKKWQGPAVGLAAQIPWFIMIWQQSLWGLLPLEIVATGLYAWGMIRWRRENSNIS